MQTNRPELLCTFSQETEGTPCTLNLLFLCFFPFHSVNVFILIFQYLVE